MSEKPLNKRIAAETLGTAMLLSTVVGSGIMGERLAAGNVAIALLANSIATGAALVALILTFGGISGAHFNPIVTLVEGFQGRLSRRDIAPYIGAQVAGAFLGVLAAHVMFELPVVSMSTHVRAGGAQLFSEALATAGLLWVIRGTSQNQPSAVPFAVGGYIAAAYWFTASTSFANPAVTLARAFSETFAGIRLEDVPGFVVAQLVGAVIAVPVFGWMNKKV